MRRAVMNCISTVLLSVTQLPCSCHQRQEHLNFILFRWDHLGVVLPTAQVVGRTAQQAVHSPPYSLVEVLPSFQAVEGHPNCLEALHPTHPAHRSYVEPYSTIMI